MFKVAHRPDGPGVNSMLISVDIILENVYKCHYKLINYLLTYKKCMDSTFLYNVETFHQKSPIFLYL